MTDVISYCSGSAMRLGRSAQKQTYSHSLNTYKATFFFLVGGRVKDTELGTHSLIHLQLGLLVPSPLLEVSAIRVGKQKI